jgi:hypothetical protein
MRERDDPAALVVIFDGLEPLVGGQSVFSAGRFASPAARFSSASIRTP